LFGAFCDGYFRIRAIVMISLHFMAKYFCRQNAKTQR